MGLQVCLRVVFFRPNSLYICDTYSICIVQTIIIIYTNACLLYVTWEKVCVCCVPIPTVLKSEEREKKLKSRDYLSLDYPVFSVHSSNWFSFCVFFFFPFGVSAVRCTYPRIVVVVDRDQ